MMGRYCYLHEMCYEWIYHYFFSLTLETPSFHMLLPENLHHHSWTNHTRSVNSINGNGDVFLIKRPRNLLRIGIAFGQNTVYVQMPTM